MGDSRLWEFRDDVTEMALGDETATKEVSKVACGLDMGTIGPSNFPSSLLITARGQLLSVLLPGTQPPPLPKWCRFGPRPPSAREQLWLRMSVRQQISFPPSRPAVCGTEVSASHKPTL
ncbi:hypothetical protein P7K49_005489 [Saguinus oedipus]|uniref:Uncharacterized protein n=1 Tax=Saguinus oedipus TaxID=9490 RepID=A0ABQ9WAG4_SAGOE|nr:hypothetical protein P7K49_005489 [Saguinus oedipus]